MNIMVENREYLIDLVSIVGDGDLGLTMRGGFTAAYNTAAAAMLMMRAFANAV